MGVKAAPAKTVHGAELRRALSPLESWFALSAMTIWYTDEVEGPLNLETLREAFHLLRTENPVIAGRFLPGSSGQTAGLPDLDLVAPAEPSPSSEIVIREEAEGSVLVDHTKELAYLNVVRRGDRTLVSFVVHHAIADGKLGAYWHTRLWSHYTDLVEGRAPVLDPRPLPKAPETLLAEHDVSKGACGPSRLHRAVPTDLPQPAEAVFTRERILLSTEQTNQIRGRARALGVTVHALVAGACAVVERHRMPVPDDVAVDLYVDSPVDIRTRLQSSDHAWDVTNALGSSAGLVSVLPDSDPVALGTLLLDQLREDVASDAVYQGILQFEEVLAADQPNIPRITTTNMGVMEAVRTPSCLFAHDFRGWVDFDGGAIAEYFATAHKGGYNRFTSLYLIYTYDGKLSVDLGLPFSAEAARAHTTGLTELLLAIGAHEARR